ncbi:MAG TPA: M28 family peptidase, partial [Thermoleophilaceae bacterium]|nr:M28 family peptidase [Thermoleophilaceae bacterium]
MKLLGIVLAVQVAVGLTLVALVATDNLPFVGDDSANGKGAPAAAVDRFDGAAAFRLLRRQVEMGPRPAGSPESLRLARFLKRSVPRGRFQKVPHGLRNVIGTVRGREPGYIVVGAHYDTKDIPGFVGANDGASGTAVTLRLARTLRRPRHSIKFVFFDGEETPRGVPDSKF